MCHNRRPTSRPAKNKSTLLLPVISATLLSLGASGAYASGFQLTEQNASGLGNAYAGSAAIAENASTIFFNPAGMTRLPGVNVSAGMVLIQPSFRFSNSGSTGPGGLPVQSNTGGNAGSLAVLPNAYMSWQVDPNWFLGLGIGAPFGMSTQYSNNWIGRYQSTSFGIETININPSIAYKVNDQLSLGAGVNWTHLSADYRRNVPATGLAPSIALSKLTGKPDLNGKVDLQGDGLGWNLGLLYQATTDTRIGLSYRSKIRINANGTTTLGNLPFGLAARTANASTTVTLPDTAIFSVVHDLNSQWQLLGDVSWTGWSSIPSLDIQNSGGSLPNESLKLKFRDTWRIALGANYKYSPKWTFKAGVAFDQSPVHDAQYRPTSLPDGNRIWLSLGTQYHFNKHATVDVGYAHLFLKNPSINNASDLTKGTVYGSYQASIDMLGVQVSYRF